MNALIARVVDLTGANGSFLGGDRLCLLILSLMLGPATVVQADDVVWNSSSGGLWSDGTKWSTGAPPDPNDNAIITLDGTYVVTLDTDATVQSLTLGASSGTQTLSVTSHTLTLDGPSSIGANAILSLRNSTVNITNTPDTLTNNGQLIARWATGIGGDGTFYNAFGGTLRVENYSNANGVLTVANGFTNAGTIELSSTYFQAGAALNVTNGALVNFNTIDTLTGAGAWRQINAELDNQGTINIAQTTSVDKPGAVNHSNAGTINVNTGGSLTLTLTDDTLTNSGGINLIGGGVTLSSAVSVTNTGTIDIGAGQLLSMSNTTFDHQAGSISGLGTWSLTTMTVNDTVSFTNNLAELQLYSSTWNGPGALTNATSLAMRSSTIDAPLANQGSLVARWTCAIDSAAGEFSNEPGGTLRIENYSNTNGVLTVANGFTNAGTIELSSTYFQAGAALNVTNGALVNFNTIDTLTGAGAWRQINAELDNQGTINIAQTTSVDKPGAVNHSNAGTINVTAGTLTFTLTGDTFSNSGTLNVAVGATLYLNGGSFMNFAVGVLTGGTYDLAGTFKFTDADVVTNAATIVLDGFNAQIVNELNVDGLANLAVNDAAGALTLTNGRNLTTAGAMANGGAITITTGCTLTSGGDYTQTGGTTTLDDGLLTASSLVDIQGGSLVGTGTIDGDLTNAGNVAPGMSAGQLAVSGDFTQTPNGTFTVEITGPTQGSEYDAMLVAGSAWLAGTLSVTLVAPYEPTVGTEFEILSANPVNDAFAFDNLPLYFGENCIGPVYDSASVTLVTALRASITQQPADQTACEGDAVTLVVAATGDPAPTYQWRKDGEDIPGATTSTLTIDPVTIDDAGAYDVAVVNQCGLDVSATATLTVYSTPTITQQPVSVTSCLGDSVVLTATADGTPTPTYQWFKGGVEIPGATANSLTIDPVTIDDAGDYTVVATNPCGSAASGAATLTVYVAPEITFDPIDEEMCEGGLVTFSVSATGTPAPTYQWRKEGVDLLGETDSSLTIDPVSPDDAGTYDVVVTNECGELTSVAATLTVDTPPVITADVEDASVYEGDPVTFSVTASGVPIPTYQWRKDGEPLPGETGTSLTIDPTSMDDAGSYDVVVTNQCGEVTSRAATLTVLTRLLLVSTEPPADGTLPKTQNNIIVCVFDAPITLPPAGDPLAIVELGDPNNDVSASFSYTVDPNDTGDPTGATLKATESGAVLSDQTWYHVSSAPGWTTVTPFAFDLCVLRGDANNSARVTTADYTEVKNHMNERTDARYDLNGSARVTTADYTVVKDHMNNRAPAKP